MTELKQPRNKAELEAAIDRGWAELEGVIGRYTEAELTGPTDAAGWTARDHLGHLAAWERSMVFLFQGKPRYEGLGVPADVYFGDDFDAINAVIQESTRDQPLDDVLAELRSVHQQLRDRVASMSDADLQQSYSHFLPDEPGEDDGSPIIGRVSGNTDSHFREHIPWIEAIVAGS